MQKDYNFYVYIVSNFKRTCFYTGFCNDILRRTIEHMHGFGSNYTKKYKTKDLLYYEHYQYVNSAIYREKEIKKWRREKKLELIKSKNPKLKSLNQELFDTHKMTQKDIQEIADILKENYRNK